VGIKTFDSNILQWMNRAHTGQDALESLKTIQSIGFNDYSCDLIFGTTHHNLNLLDDDINKILDHGASHVSTYSLTIEPSTAFSKFEQSGQTLLSDDENVIEQMHYITTKLSSHGLERYEVSNYAKEGAISKHNSAYWKNKHYLGIGPSAHSYSGTHRRVNIAHNQKYLSSIQKGKTFFESEVLTDKDLINEHILTRLRTIWGVDLSFIGGLDKGFKRLKAPLLNQQISKGNITQKNEHLYITDQGIKIIDSITADLFL
jgi:oxygen-independent coproporphyrinogen-3 oxidase